MRNTTAVKASVRFCEVEKVKVLFSDELNQVVLWNQCWSLRGGPMGPVRVTICERLFMRYSWSRRGGLTVQGQ